MKKIENNKTHALNLRIPVEVYQSLKTLAQKNGTNVAIEARLAIVDRLNSKGRVYK